MCVVAGKLMSIQTASIEDPRPKSTWSSPLSKNGHNGLYYLRFLKLVVAFSLDAFWEAIFGLVVYAGLEK